MFLAEETTLGTGGIVALVSGVVVPLTGLLGLLVKWIVTRLSKALDRFSDTLDRLANSAARSESEAQRLACAMDSTTEELRRLGDKLGTQEVCPWTPVAAHEVTMAAQQKRHG